MTRWTWTYQLIDDGGNVSSRLIADHDDESLSDVQARFTEFLRGCGYHVPGRNYGDPGTEALIDELQNRIAELEERQLAPGEVAVKVPPVRQWPERGEYLDLFITGYKTSPWYVNRLITRAEAEAREAGR